MNPDAVPIRGDQPADYGSPAPAQGAPAGVLVQPGRQAGQPVQPEAGGGQGGGIYLGDDAYTDPDDQQDRFVGQIPELHVVRRGDTLWDLCGYYFDDPWRWPKIWSYNPTITNPHWIYPGDVVRLFGEGEVAPVQEINRTETAPRMAFDDPTRSNGVELRQLAFLRPEEIKLAGEIVGSSEDKLLLTQGDEIFIEYPSGKPPQVGKRYAIYTPKEDVKHPEGGSRVGTYVLLRGEVQIVEVKKDKKARGQITYVTGIIERGYNVGPVKTQFRDVKPTPADKNLEGVVVGIIGVDELIGEGMVVFVDRGKSDGLKVGNALQIVRRGDAYKRDHRMEEGGRDDRRYPDEIIGEILVVDVADKAAVALVTMSFEEALVGDHVVLRKGK